MEKPDRALKIEKAGGVFLNQLISAKLDTPESISIHVGDSAGLPWSESYLMFVEGMRSLAVMLERNQDFKEVKEITATSWIVTKHPTVLEGLGFTITDQGGSASKMLQSGIYTHAKSEPWRHAYMRRDDFIRRYGRTVPE